MKFKLLTAALFLISNFVFAQQQRFVLPLGEEILLAKASNANDKSNLGLEIIDLSGDIILGYIPTEEASNDRVGIYAPLPKQEWLTTLISASNVASALGSGSSLLLILSDISVGGTNNMSYVGMKGNLYSSLAGKDAYSLIKKIDEFYVNKTVGLRESSNNIINLLRSALSPSQLGGVINQGLTKNKASVIKEEQNRTSFISNGVFPSGIYMSFEELKLLKPRFDQFFLKVDTLNRQVQVNSFTINDSTLRPTDGAYAIVAGNEVYLYSNKKLYPVESRGSNLIFSKYVDPINRKNSANFWRDNVGVRFKDRQDGNPFDNKQVLQIDNYRGNGIKGEATKINNENGMIEL